VSKKLILLPASGGLDMSPVSFLQYDLSTSILQSDGMAQNLEMKLILPGFTRLILSFFVHFVWFSFFLCGINHKSAVQSDGKGVN